MKPINVDKYQPLMVGGGGLGIDGPQGLVRRVLFYNVLYWGFPGDSDGKRIHLQCRRPQFNPWVGKIPWRREWLPTPVFLSGYPMDRGAWQATVPWVSKESDTTE